MEDFSHSLAYLSTYCIRIWNYNCLTNKDGVGVGAGLLGNYGRTFRITVNLGYDEVKNQRYYGIWGNYC